VIERRGGEKRGKNEFREMCEVNERRDDAYDLKYYKYFTEVNRSTVN
jgi:hypothetical protein